MAILGIKRITIHWLKYRLSKNEVTIGQESRSKYHRAGNEYRLIEGFYCFIQAGHSKKKLLTKIVQMWNDIPATPVTFVPSGETTTHMPLVRILCQIEPKNCNQFSILQTE